MRKDTPETSKYLLMIIAVELAVMLAVLAYLLGG